MINDKYVKIARFDIKNENRFLILGYLPETDSVWAEYDSEPLKTEVSEWQEMYPMRLESTPDSEIAGTLIAAELPEKRRSGGSLVIKACINGDDTELLRMKGRALKRLTKCPQYYIEKIQKDKKEGLIGISGWIASTEKPVIKAYSKSGRELECSVDLVDRLDIIFAYPEFEIYKNCGADIKVSSGRKNFAKLVISCGDRSTKISVYTGAISRIKNFLSRSVDYVRRKGIWSVPKKAISMIRSRHDCPGYKLWTKHNLPSKEELNSQRKAVFGYAPKISIAVPLYKTPENFLDRLISSVKAQTYSDWELLLSDGSGEDSPIAGILEKYAAGDKRIVIIKNGRPRRIAENTNAALEAATGDYVAFADHDDELREDALYEVVKALNADERPELIYTDEDKINSSDTELSEPNMKPEFNRELLRSVNYICHLLVVKKSLLDAVGRIREGYEGAQDYDLILRLVEKTDKIKRIPKVLYHWRMHSSSTSANPQAKNYAFESGKKALQDHYARCGIKASVSVNEETLTYHTRFIREYDPLVTIMIPNKDHIEDLKTCVEAIEERSTYRNFEILVIENNSTREKTFKYYEELGKQYDNIRVVRYEGGFNFSLINNYGEKYASGEYLLLLNNDTRMINDDALEEMLGYCMLGDVGAVGARLYYGDDTVQHAGVVVGIGGTAGHCFILEKRFADGHNYRSISAQDYSAVTAACMMVKRSAYNEVGGMSEYLAVAFNDIDFCLKLREAGYLIVYNPYAEFYHYESKSRGLEDTMEKVRRFNAEANAFSKKWADILKNGDPYYSPNLSLESQDFSLRKNW